MWKEFKSRFSTKDDEPNSNNTLSPARIKSLNDCLNEEPVHGSPSKKKPRFSKLKLFASQDRTPKEPATEPNSVQKIPIIIIPPKG